MVGLWEAEQTPEIAGVGNHYTAQFWEYDPRIARRWNLDPKPQISISDYAVNSLNPIITNDVLGDRGEPRWACPALTDYSDRRSVEQRFSDWVFKTSGQEKMMDIVGNDLNTVLNYHNGQKHTFGEMANYLMATAKIAGLISGAGEIGTAAIESRMASGVGRTAMRVGTTARAAAGDMLPGQLRTFSNLEARQWYFKMESKIPSFLNKSAPLEIQARQAFTIRNGIRTFARELMADRAEAARLYMEEPKQIWC